MTRDEVHALITEAEAEQESRSPRFYAEKVVPVLWESMKRIAYLETACVQNEGCVCGVCEARRGVRDVRELLRSGD